MTINAAELTKDRNFWKLEKEILDRACDFINAMKRIKPFDVHKLQPQTYDLKMLGDPQSGRAAKKKAG